MLKKIFAILSFYDTEPVEIYQGLTWLIIFPVVHIAENNADWWIAGISMLIGAGSIKAACYHKLCDRKNIALATFILSLLAIFMFIKTGHMFCCLSHLWWILVSISALFNLIAITNHYYNNGSNR